MKMKRMLLALIFGMFLISLVSAGELHNSTFMNNSDWWETGATDSFCADWNGEELLIQGGTTLRFFDLEGVNSANVSIGSNGAFCNNGTNYFKVHDWGGVEQVYVYNWTLDYLYNFSMDPLHVNEQGIACWEDKVYVGDYGRHEVAVYYTNGTFVQNYSIPQSSITGMTAKDGYIYMVNGSDIVEYNLTFSVNDVYNTMLGSGMRGLAWAEEERAWAIINYTATEIQDVFIFPEVAELNLTFSQNETGQIIYDEGSISFTNVDILYYSMFDFAEGYVYVLFNNGTQMFSFYNDYETFVSEYLYVQEPDLNQEVKVLDGSAEISKARVTFEIWDEGSLGIVYSAYTDINGIVPILLKDTQMYKVTVEKEGYDDYVGLHYIPPSNDETIIINLVETGSAVTDDMIVSSCLNVIGTNQTCNFTVFTTTSGNTVGFNYTWNGSSYYEELTTNSPVTLSLLAENWSTPINVTITVDGVVRKIFTVEYEGLGERSIQLNFDVSEIKSDDSNLLLFYLIAILIGVIFMVSINRIPKAEGYGIYGMTAWFLILATVGFLVFWFIVIPIALYLIFRHLWGEAK